MVSRGKNWRKVLASVQNHTDIQCENQSKSRCIPSEKWPMVRIIIDDGVVTDYLKRQNAQDEPETICLQDSSDDDSNDLSVMFVGEARATNEQKQLRKSNFRCRRLEAQIAKLKRKIGTITMKENENDAAPPNFHSFFESQNEKTDEEPNEEPPNEEPPNEVPPSASLPVNTEQSPLNMSFGWAEEQINEWAANGELSLIIRDAGTFAAQLIDEIEDTST